MALVTGSGIFLRAEISAALPEAKVMAIQQVVKGRLETIGHFKRFSYLLSALVVLAGGLVALVTMMAAVRERTAEIGIFRAVGFRAGHVVRVVLWEALLVSALAGALGWLLGLGLVQAALPLLADGHGAIVPVDPWLAGGSLALAVTVGLLASLYPALMAARLDPNEALRAL